MASGIMIETCTFKIIFLSAILWVNAASECYFPNKALARRDTPCYADGRVSHCCSPNAICLTNQLCLSVSQPFSLSRGSCTDQDWGSDCPSICDTFQPNGGAIVAHYNGTRTDSTYCCGSVVSKDNELICSTVKNKTQEPFKILNGTFIPGVAALANYEGSNSTSTSSNTGPTTTSDDPKLTAVGAGVGVPLGVIAIAASIWALCERRKRKRMTLTPAAPVFSDSRNGNAAEMYRYPQKSSRRLNGAYGEEQRSY